MTGMKPRILNTETKDCIAVEGVESPEREMESKAIARKSNCTEAAPNSIALVDYYRNQIAIGCINSIFHFIIIYAWYRTRQRVLNSTKGRLCRDML